MPAIERIVFIRAAPEAVFDLISRVEDFEHYTRLIRSIRRTGRNLYHWVVAIAGFELQWDATVTKHVRPHCFAWHTVHGVENGGRFELSAAEGGTRVCLTMHYRLANPLLERLVDRLATPLIDRVAGEILEQVRRRLEDVHTRSAD